MRRSPQEGVGREMKRNSHSCGILVFMFDGQIKLLREKKDDNGKYHMRIVIALVSYIIVSSSSRPPFSFPPSRYHSCVSSIRLVSHLVLDIVLTLSHVDIITP